MEKYEIEQQEMTNKLKQHFEDKDANELAFKTKLKEEGVVASV